MQKNAFAEMNEKDYIEIEELIKNGEIIKAIGRYRELTGADLATAKAAVDNFELIKIENNTSAKQIEKTTENNCEKTTLQKNEPICNNNATTNASKQSDKTLISKNNIVKIAIIAIAAIMVLSVFKSCFGTDLEDGTTSASEGIKANYWYTSTEVDILKVQNCEIHSATLKNSGNSVFVSYYPVCESCHKSATIQSMAAPEINYPVIKNYYCDECGTTTIVKLKIEY